VLNRDEDESKLRLGEMAGISKKSESDRNWQVGKSPAVRIYRPGEGFSYAAMVYRGRSKKKEVVPKLQTQFTLFKDGKEYFKGNPEEVTISETQDLSGIPISKRLMFNKGMEAGPYILQLTITEKQGKEISSTAIQSIDFQIRKGAAEESIQ
jgi:hypothetical protein